MSALFSELPSSGGSVLPLTHGAACCVDLFLHELASKPCFVQGLMSVIRHLATPENLVMMGNIL